MRYSPRQKIGAILLDWPRFEWRMLSSWMRICNRSERLTSAPVGRGVACQWKWTSDLHITKVFPSLGGRLLRKVLKEWPIAFADAPAPYRGERQVSFIFGHRGVERIPQLLAALRTIAAQRRIRCECVLVEQSAQAELPRLLPSWVRYMHTPVPVPEMPYCRAWAFNIGARVATGKVLVFHDGDMLIPVDYASELWDRYENGFEVINLKRFIFYLDEDQSKAVQSMGTADRWPLPQSIIQNAEAGGSIAIGKETFLAIGGYDESFVGWGGEDNEFWERAQTRKVWPYGYLPFIHLWHPPQPRKGDPANPTFLKWAKRSTVTPTERIIELAARQFGNPQALSVEWPGAE